MTAHSVLNVRAALEWGNSELYKYYERNGLGYGTVQLGAVLSQKQSNRQYHPIAFGSHSLTLAEKNYHSSKLEFLTLKWSVTEHFKEYLAYVPFVVRTDNNPLTYVLTMPNLVATGHQLVGIPEGSQ